jgi:hypothetical protein
MMRRRRRKKTNLSRYPNLTTMRKTTTVAI